MKKNNDPFADVFDQMQEESLPTAEQKAKMLQNVLMESGRAGHSAWARAGMWIAVYPWRFAFSVAAAQALAGVLIFGTGYTNLLLSVFGG